MKQGIYVTSKLKHAPMWIKYRDQGWPIISSWLGKSDSLDSDGLRSLWTACVDECGSCDCLVAYVEPGDVLRGGVVEIGAALSAGIPVLLVGDCIELGTANLHPLVKGFSSIDEAMREALHIVKTSHKQTA